MLVKMLTSIDFLALLRPHTVNVMDLSIMYAQTRHYNGNLKTSV